MNAVFGILLVRNIRKEIHPGTKPSVDFIHKILEDAYDSGLGYDVFEIYERIFLRLRRRALIMLKRV